MLAFHFSGGFFQCFSLINLPEHFWLVCGQFNWFCYSFKFNISLWKLPIKKYLWLYPMMFRSFSRFGRWKKTPVVLHQRSFIVTHQPTSPFQRHSKTRTNEPDATSNSACARLEVVICWTGVATDFHRQRRRLVRTTPSDKAVLRQQSLASADTRRPHSRSVIFSATGCNDYKKAPFR